MPDIVTPEIRSRMMSGIRGKNTQPELILRRQLHARGFRFRLHDKLLPGKPDLVFPRLNAVLFVHGCFWHGHDCNLFRLPSTRTEFWNEKISRNRVTDRRASDALMKLDWRLGIVWECAMRGRTRRPLPLLIDECANWLRSAVPFWEARGLLTA